MNLKLTLCSLVGHSRIISYFMGYQYCGRCKEQIGDTLSGVGVDLSVGIGHNCEKCRTNYKLMTWKDKFLVKNPFNSYSNEK